MQSQRATEELVLLMKARNSGRSLLEVPATMQLADELNTVVVPTIPSAGGFKPLLFGLSVMDRLQIIATPTRPTVQKYGHASNNLLNLEAGTLAAFANLYLMTRGYQVRYIYTGTPESTNIRLMLTLALYKK
jgi:hypothetical protein